MSKVDYLSYLESKEWQSKRKQCFSFHGKQCACCQKKTKLHVHHKTYKRLGNENVVKDLVPLCEKHHKALHKFCDEKGDLFVCSLLYLEQYGKYRITYKKPKKRFERINKKKKNRKIKKAKGNAGVKQPKYFTLPNDMSKFKAVISVEI